MPHIPQEESCRFEAAINAARAAGDKEGEADNLLYLGRRHYLFNHNAPPAKDCFQKSLAISREIDDKSREMESLIGLGDCMSEWFWEERDYAQAIRFYEQALTLAQTIGNRESEGDCLSRIGSVENLLQHHNEAMKHFEKALSIARETGDKRDEGSRLRNIGKQHSELGNYQQAIQFIEQAVAVYQSIPEDTYDAWSPAHCLGNIAQIYYKQGNLEQAALYYQRGLTMTREAGPSLEEAFVLRFKGLLKGIAPD